MSNFLHKPYTNAEALTVGSDAKSPGRGLCITATVAGTVRVKLSSGNTVDVLAAVGTTWIDNIAVIGIVSNSGGTATYYLMS